MEPTKAETLTWVVLAIIAWTPFIISFLPIDWSKRKNDDDPYRYCPKEEDEW